MRRTVIFVTLISLLIAVAGVTAAQNGVVDLDRETTTPEPSPEATGETPEPTIRETPERLEGTTVEQPGDEARPGDGGKHRAKTPGPEDGGNSAGPEGERGGDDQAEPDGRGERPPGEKVTVCHRGKTLSVGAPAKPAHLGHGDSSGPC